MSETITVDFPDISGESDTYTAFLRRESDGALLNTSGDAITESGSTGLWSFTLGEARAANTNYLVRIYSGSSETATNLVYSSVLFSGQTLVGMEFQAINKTVIRGTVSSTSPGVSSFTPSQLSTAQSVLNQLRGRVLIFDNTTTTEALRGQATQILGSSAAALPLLTVVALTTAPVSGDTFTIV